MLPLDLNALTPAASPVNPLLQREARQAAPAAVRLSRSNFLEETLGRADLSKLCSLLDHFYGHGKWAFTGSTALMIHAQAIGAPGLEFGRTPSDADVMVDAFTLAFASYDNISADPVCKSAGLGYVGDKREVLELASQENDPPLKIDLISSDRRNFGSLGSGDSITVEGVPVLSLDALIASLEQRLESGDSGPHSQQDLVLARGLAGRHQQAPSAQEGSPLGRGDLYARRLERSLSGDMGSTTRKLMF